MCFLYERLTLQLGRNASIALQVIHVLNTHVSLLVFRVSCALNCQDTAAVYNGCHNDYFFKMKDGLENPKTLQRLKLNVSKTMIPFIYLKCHI